MVRAMEKFSLWVCLKRKKVGKFSLIFLIKKGAIQRTDYVFYWNWLKRWECGGGSSVMFDRFHGFRELIEAFKPRKIKIKSEIIEQEILQKNPTSQTNPPHPSPQNTPRRFCNSILSTSLFYLILSLCNSLRISILQQRHRQNIKNLFEIFSLMICKVFK